jgi:hypothetical protein
MEDRMAETMDQERTVGGGAQQPANPAVGASASATTGAGQVPGKELVLSGNVNSKLVKVTPEIKALLRVAKTQQDLARQLAAPAALARKIQNQQLDAIRAVNALNQVQEAWRPLLDSIADASRIHQVMLPVAQTILPVMRTMSGPLSVIASIDETNRLINSSVGSLAADLARVQQAVTAATMRALQAPTLPSQNAFDDLRRSLLLVAAERARQGFLAGGGLEAVADFALGWLGLRPKRRFRTATLEAVVDVLLANEWRVQSIEPAVGSYDGLRKWLRKEVTDTKQEWTPFWHRQLAHQKVGSLNLPMVRADGGQTEVGNLVPSTTDVETAVMNAEPWTETPWVKSLTGHLSEEEMRVCLLVAEEGLPWSQAAVAAGLSEKRGKVIKQRVQRWVAKTTTFEDARALTIKRAGVAA